MSYSLIYEYSNFYDIEKYTETKKTVLLIFAGLPRTFSKTIDNIFDNLIKPNMDSYIFTIYISTESDIPKETYDQLYNKYNQLNQLKKIVYYHCEGKLWGGGRQLKRYNDILEIDKNIYDFTILMRLDIILNKVIDLNNYINKFLIVTGPHLIPPHWLHNKDHDYMWIGYKNSLYIFYSLSLELSKKNDILLDFKNFISNNKNCGIEPYNIGLKGNNTPGYHGFKVMNYIQKCNYTVKLSEYDNITATIIR